HTLVLLASKRAPAGEAGTTRGLETTRGSGFTTNRQTVLRYSGGNKLFLARRKFQLRRHSNQFRQRFGFHLPHRPATLDLHGDFAVPELSCYLLIEHPRNHQAHDLALTWGQRLIPFSQLGQVS